MTEKNRYHHGDLRAALLAAAEEELADRGVEGFTLRGVAKRAGVSHSAPAHHFKDTGALLTELAAVGFARFLDALRAREAEADDAPISRLTAACLGYVDFATAKPALFRLMFSSQRPDLDDPTLIGPVDASFEHLVLRVRQALGREDDPEPPMLDVLATWSVIHGISDLINSGRLKKVGMTPAQREAAIRQIVARLYG